ncbi:CDP-alcohol phosphatidyltransferase family protein [Candidatus Woesearchaeota archaeon]|nr:CDP-alcohol phosphatidyltransferase family protein [Candidatus Woesearchaeota archaeon]
MDFIVKIVKWFRKQRTKYLMPLGKLFVKLRIKALYLTILAFGLGVVAVYYLFLNNFYFVLFGVLHLIFDGLDGVVARVNNKETKFGAHFDNISDRSIVVLALIKSYFYFNDYFVLIVLAIYLLHHLIYIFSNLESKVAYSRLLTLVLYFLGFYVLGYFLVGAISLYGLAQQFNYFLKKKFTT